MRVIRTRLEALRPERRTVLTFGNFDGFHVGHRALLARTLQRANETKAEAVALTFEPHPLQIFKPESFRLIQTLATRLDALANAGLGSVVVADFSPELAAYGPEAFVSEWLCTRFDLAHVVVGYNTTFGRGRSGSPALMHELGARLGFGVDTVEPVLYEGAPVSSSRIREAIAAGRVELAAHLMGHPHRLSGEVVHGFARGAKLGFPTANIALPYELVWPAPGIYAVWAYLDGRRLRGALNIGSNPTFEDGTLSIETHLLDYEGDCYGHRLTLDFVALLREERRFASVSGLTAQIARDVAEVRRVLR